MKTEDRNVHSGHGEGWECAATRLVDLAFFGFHGPELSQSGMDRVADALCPLFSLCELCDEPLSAA